MQDMFHAISAENRFSCKADVVDGCTNVFKFWKDSLLPATLMYAETNLVMMMTQIVRMHVHMRDI